MNNWYKRAQVSKEKFKGSKIPHDPLFKGEGGKAEGDRREKILCDAIRKMAKEWNIGPITEPLRIDPIGNIKMLQKQRITPGDYVNPQPIDQKLVDIAIQYSGYGPGISKRWLNLNHFIWEKMLGDMGLLPRTPITKEDFLEDISK